MDLQMFGGFGMIENIRIGVIGCLLYGSLIGSYGESLVFPPYSHSYGIRKATPKHLFMFFGPRTSFKDPQGVAAVRLKSWDDPKSAKDDDEVTVYGVNSGRHQIIYNTSMYTLGMYGKKGSGKDRLNNPKGIGADSKGNVVVADYGNNRIVHLFNPKSELEWRSAFVGDTANGNGLKGPTQVAIDERETVYAADEGNNRIVVFDISGNVKQYIPSKASFSFENGPTALAIADGRARWSYFDSERILFCADRNGTRLWKLDLKGNVLKKVSVPSGYTISYGAIDYYHNFWATDTKRHCVLKWDHNLKLLDIFGSHGSGDNQFEQPRGIAIYKRFGQVFVAEEKGAQYYWVGTHLKNAKLKPVENSYKLDVLATEYSYVSLFTANGTDTTYYLKRRMMYPGRADMVLSESQSEKIKGKNNVMLKIEPTYSSRSFYAWFYPISPE